MRIALTAILLCAACGPTARDPGPGGDDDPSPDAGPNDPPPPLGDGGSNVGCEGIDVLFVIDNSGSMQQEQDNLVANFPQFVNVLEQSGLDYRIGVTTTGRDYEWTMAAPIGPALPMDQDGGDNGALRKKAPMTKRWIEKADGNVSAMFSELANVGIDGPSKEMPLAAIRDAFEERIADGTNADFHRPNALLAVVILTDEEDCSHDQSVNLGFGQELCSGGSADPVVDYIQFLDQFTGNHTRWATAVIAGPTDCSSSFGDANEAERLKDFVQQVGVNARFSSICEGDLSIGLAEALALFDSACGGVIL